MATKARLVVASRRSVALSLAAAALSAAPAFAVDGTWTQPAGGTYSDPLNWLGGTVAGGADALANFNTVDVTTIAPVTLTSDITLGSLTFGDTDITTPGGWQVGGAFAINLAGAAPTITTNALAVGSTARIDSVLAGTAANVTFTGAGTTYLTATSTYTGTTTLTNANLRLGATNTFNGSMLGLANSTLTLNGTNTISNGNTASGTMFIGNNIVAAAGSTTTFNLGNRSSIGQTGTGNQRTVTGSGNLIFNLGSNTSRNDFLNSFAAFTGNVTFDAPTQVLGTDGVSMVSPVARLLINGGNFGGFNTANLTLSNFAVLQVNTNSGGNTVNIGSLSGTSGLAGFLSPSSGGAATLSIGANNTSTSFAGLFVGNNIVTKVGTGTLTLTSSQLNTNATNANAGTLALSGAGDLPLSPTINIANGATFDVSGMSAGAYKIHGNAVANVSAVQTLQTPAGSTTATVKGNLDLSEGTAVLQPGTTTGASTLNINGNLNLAGGILNMELSPNPAPGGTNDLLNVTGTTSLGSGLTLNLGLIGGLTANSTYTLVQSTGGFSGSTAGWTVNFGGRGSAPSIVQTANALQVQVGAIGGANLVFTGAVNGNWDINSTANWTNTATSGADKFFQLDSVRFDDTATNKAVTIVGTVAPTAVVVDTTAGYTFSGTGGIVGSASLTKNGAGTLTIGNTGANTYTGGTTINGGIVDIGTLGQNGIGTGVITLNNGTTLRAVTPTGGNITLANAIAVNGSATLITANSGTTARQTILNGPITGTGSLSLTNDNLASNKGVDIADTSGFNGTLTVNDGFAVRFTSATTSGSAGMALVINGTGGVGTINASALVIPLGSLSGNGTLRGHQSNGNGSTAEFQIGALNTSTSFTGTIVDGAQSGAARAVLVTKVGTGTLTLTGTNTYTGATTVKAGTLVLGLNAQGPVLGSSTVTAPTGADIQGGKLVLDYTGGTTPAATVQSILTAGYSQTPQFSTGLLRSTTHADNHLLGWIDNTTASTVTIGSTIAGDTNVDFTVNFNDLLSLAQNYGGSSKVWAQGDANYDGVVNFTDLLALAQNYGKAALDSQQVSLVGGSFASDFAMAQSLVSVPEPTIVGLLGAASLLVSRRRR